MIPLTKEEQQVIALEKIHNDGFQDGRKALATFIHNEITRILNEGFSHQIVCEHILSKCRTVMKNDVKLAPVKYYPESNIS